ncbi:MAG: hypothetical protein ACYCZR_06190 [Burkholderiales bacterium]
MSTKLSDSNPYLRDPTQRQRSVLLSVATSSAIEGIRAPFKKKASPAKPAAKKSSGTRPVVVAAKSKSR